MPLIYLSTDGHLGCFQILAMVNNAAMNIGVNVLLNYTISNKVNYFYSNQEEGKFLTCSMSCIYKT